MALFAQHKIAGPETFSTYREGTTDSGLLGVSLSQGVVVWPGIHLHTISIGFGGEVERHVTGMSTSQVLCALSPALSTAIDHVDATRLKFSWLLAQSGEVDSEQLNKCMDCFKQVRRSHSNSTKSAPKILISRTMHQVLVHLRATLLLLSQVFWDGDSSTMPGG